MDFQLTDEQRLISESAREFCDKEIAPRVRDNHRAGRFDRELASKLGEMGYLGAPVAEEYGGRSLEDPQADHRPGRDRDQRDGPAGR